MRRCVCAARTREGEREKETKRERLGEAHAQEKRSGGGEVHHTWADAWKGDVNGVRVALVHHVDLGRPGGGAPAGAQARGHRAVARRRPAHPREGGQCLA